jgi:uncharacterized MAPEG superfamily protein
MHTLVICLFIITTIPLLLALATIPFRIKQFGRPDLQDPRGQGANLTGIGQRLSYAQANAWEALALFGAALLSAVMMKVDASQLHTASYLFVSARILHSVFYVCHLGVLRFLSFLASFMCIAWIFMTTLGVM